MQIVTQHTKHRHLLAAMMGSMRQTASHHPGSGALHIKELRQLLPPMLVFWPKDGEPLAAMFRVTFHEPDAGFLFRKRRGTAFDAQHVAKPQVLAHALMHHVLVHAPAARIALPRPYREIFVLELAPHAQNFHSFRLVSLDQKIVFHGNDTFLGRRKTLS